MAENINDLIRNLTEFRDALPAVLPEVATSVSLTAKALSERKIREQGFGEKYSTNPVPAFFFSGQELNGAGASFIEGLKNKAKKSHEPAETTWGEFRAAQGLQNAFVDLGYSNKMWAGMFPQEVEIAGFVYTAPLGNNSVEGQNKMNWNFERYGDFVGKVIVGETLDTLYEVAYDELRRLIEEKLQWEKR